MSKPNTAADTPDQRRLRVTISDEIEAVLRKHDVGGVVMLASRESASWRFVIPQWAYLLDVDGKGFVLRINTKTADAAARTESTLHLVGSFRDIARDCVEVFGRMMRVAKMQIANAGGELTHDPFGGATHRPDPQGGKAD
jgi:hypothetical protein